MNDRFKILAILILLPLMATMLAGQSATAKIFGKVKNSNGDLMPGVTVTVTHIESNADTSTSTEKKGTFRFLGLFPGTYQASFDLAGYQPLVISGIRLQAEQSVNLKITIKKKEENQESSSN